MAMDWFENRPTNKTTRKKVAQFIQNRLDLVKLEQVPSCAEEIRMLDYACGNGFMSRIFAPHVSSITAVDISAPMVEMYNANSERLGPLHKDTRAIVGNLLSELTSPPSLPGDFNLVTLGAALHALPDAEEAVKCLAGRLRPGGVLYIQDLLHEDNSDSGCRPRGFTRDEMSSMMNSAGLVDIRFEVLPEELEIELLTEKLMRVRYFVARGVK